MVHHIDYPPQKYHITNIQCLKNIKLDLDKGEILFLAGDIASVRLTFNI